MISFDLPADQYHALRAISKSGLDRIAQSPAHFISWLEEPRKSSPALEFGTAVHAAVLEPNTFDNLYWVGKLDRRTKEGKAQAEEIEASGKKILSEDDYERIQRVQDSVLTHPAAKDLFSSGRPEVSITRNFAGADAKCRMDWLIDGGLIVDLKTTECASPEQFAKSCATFRYHVQAAFYQDMFEAETGIKPVGFYFVSVEKTAPYATAVYELDQASIDLGRELYQRDLSTYLGCLSKDKWPGYSTTVESLSLPRWAFAA